MLLDEGIEDIGVSFLMPPSCMARKRRGSRKWHRHKFRIESAGNGTRLVCGCLFSWSIERGLDALSLEILLDERSPGIAPTSRLGLT